MQCRICQYELPQNVTFCPNCGTPDALPNQGVAPTVFAPTPNQEAPAAYPTPPPEPPSYVPYPTTNYGESAPPPPPPIATPYPSYDTPPTPYGTPQYGAPQQNLYGAPMPMYAQPQPQKGSNRGCIIAVVVVVSLFVLIVGGIAAAGAIAYNTTHNALATVNAQSASAQATFASDQTPIPTTNPNLLNGPNPSQIDANAATMVISAQSSSGIDSNYAPTDSQSAFATGDTVYVTFTTAGKTGYVMSKWFLNGQDDADSTPVADTNGQTAGYFSHSFSTSGTAVVGIYWCTQSDCSDAALAQIVNVTIS